jgi:hypothetical protein
MADEQRSSSLIEEGVIFEFGDVIDNPPKIHHDSGSRL